jgi:hypothetical protein
LSETLKVKGKGGGLLVALVFALSFGGVGAFTAWVVGATLWDAWQASGWTRVPAEVLGYENGHVQYRYELNERTYLGSRIGIAAIESDEGAGDAGSRIQKALNDKAPLEVLVDPDDPSRSVVDTTIPWTMVVGFLPFALGFSTVGLGALGVMIAMMMPERAGDDEDEAISSDAVSGFLGLALFTFLWNAIAFPIAGIVILESWKGGDWVALLVLIFPLVGLLMIWAVINSGIGWIRRGGAKLHPQQMPPRLGQVFSGHVAFARGVAAGDAFKVTLRCTASGSKEQGEVTHWKAEQQGRVADVGGRRRLSLRFDPPDRIAGFERDAVTQWQLDLFPAGKEVAAFSFPFKMQPPAGVEHLPEEELEAPMAGDADGELAPAGIPKGFEALADAIGREKIQEKIDRMSPAQRAQFHAHFDNLPPGQQAAMDKIGKYAHHWPLIRKLLFWVVGLFILVQVVGVVSVFLFSS